MLVILYHVLSIRIHLHAFRFLIQSDRAKQRDLSVLYSALFLSTVCFHHVIKPELFEWLKTVFAHWAKNKIMNAGGTAWVSERTELGWREREQRMKHVVLCNPRAGVLNAHVCLRLLTRRLSGSIVVWDITQTYLNPFIQRLEGHECE